MLEKLHDTISHNVERINTPFGKFNFNTVPMVFWNSLFRKLGRNIPQEFVSYFESELMKS